MNVSGHLGITYHPRVRRRRNLGFLWLGLTFAAAIAWLPAAHGELAALARALVRGWW